MKAFKILKIIYKDCKDWNDKGFQTEYSTDVLLEAVAELEALENRSCFGCKYSSKTVSGVFCMCFSLYPDFEYCSDWEAK